MKTKKEYWVIIGVNANLPEPIVEEHVFSEEDDISEFEDFDEYVAESLGESCAELEQKGLRTLALDEKSAKNVAFKILEFFLSK